MRMPGFPGGSVAFDVTAEAFYAGSEPEGEVAAPVGSLARMRQVGSAFERALAAAERGCIVIGVGGSKRRDDVRRMARAAGIVGMWGKTDHTGEMAVECGVPYIYGTVYALHLGGAETPQQEFHRRAALLHGKRVRMRSVGEKALVEVVE